MSAAGPTATPGHRALTSDQRAMIEKIRAARRAFIAVLHEAGGTEAGHRLASANLTLSLRHIEDAEYRAVRHVTLGPSE